MGEKLTLWRPQVKLVKNLGALSEYAKCSQSSTKKFEILTLYPGCNGMDGKKPSHATVPLNLPPPSDMTEHSRISS